MLRIMFVAPFRLMLSLVAWIDNLEVLARNIPIDEVNFSLKAKLKVYPSLPVYALLGYN